MAESNRLNQALWPANSRCDEKSGELSLGGVKVSQLIAQYQTPAFILDENDFRSRDRKSTRLNSSHT